MLVVVLICAVCLLIISFAFSCGARGVDKAWTFRSAEEALKQIWTKCCLSWCRHNSVDPVSFAQAQPASVITRCVSFLVRYLDLTQSEYLHRIKDINRTWALYLFWSAGLLSHASVDNMHTPSPLTRGFDSNILGSLRRKHPLWCRSSEHIPDGEWIMKLKSWICLLVGKRLDLVIRSVHKN